MTSEHDVAANNDPTHSRRAHYLQAIGLDQWLNRANPIEQIHHSSELTSSASAESAQACDEAPPDSATMVPAQSFATPSATTSVDLDNPSLSLDDIAQRVRSCQACDLHTHRQNTVFGSGPVGARWMFVGEAPGAQEDRQGEPFVGAGGQLLNAMLGAMNMSREEVYIANVLKCRPPGNRDPMGEEVRRCEPFLLEQIERIKPRILIAMGRFAAQSLLKSTESIGRLRGSVHRYGVTDLPLLVTYHPAYLLRNPVDKRRVWDDLLLARRTLQGLSQ